MTLAVTDIERVERSKAHKLLIDLVDAVDGIGVALRDEHGYCIICGAAASVAHDPEAACGDLAAAFMAVDEAGESEDFCVATQVEAFWTQSLASGEIVVTYKAVNEPIERGCAAYGVFDRMAIAKWVEDVLNQELERR